MRTILVLFLVLSGAVWANDADTFRSPTAGFEVTKPSAWQFATAAQTQENLKRTKLSDSEFQTAMLKYATVPMVAMMKYPEPYDDINPSFKVNIKPLGQLIGKTPIELLNVVLPQLQTVFTDYHVSQSPIETEVSGLKAGYARINYSLETADGSTFPCASELWIVPRGEYFFLIGAGTRQDEATGSRSEIRAILDSVKIEN
jgi:hypothetical protein